MNHQSSIAGEPIALRLGSFAAHATVGPRARETVRLLMLDVAGLCVAARHTDYVRAALASTASQGSATAIGHAGGLGPYDAALVNGTAAHGEDFDDTFEGGPVHAGAVIVPAVLAAAEHRGLSGEAVLRGIAVGTELMCRMSLVAPQAIHKACFHPTAVIGAPAAAAAVASALDLPPKLIAHAIGIAGSLASGIIEYLADGSWTKRLHAGAAAQAGIRAAFLAEAGFLGPATVIEGHHGFYRAFAPSKTPDFAPLLDGLGESWILETLAFKPYACGTMTQPFVDCAIALAKQGVKAEDIVSLECEVGEGTVHRLWEPLALKQSPPNAYAAKFSTPYCIAVGFMDGGAGLGQFTEERVAEASVRALAAKVSYVIDPANEYPRNFSGHIKATLRDGTVREARQPHMRGGAHEPLSTADILQKFHDNAAFGGWERRRSGEVEAALDRIAAGGSVDLTAARG
ncbi:MmgE/PrpD family protein [Bosea caraganae]|uniref:MmgE/PrpD family protein n=1 Tax=Bosea caraganae TaxID=2763117 RepID=A0A370L9Z1_9HYPH|nr:MmgE/PrpD family protein [Bosea caraganae]RDJ21831.1 MmgE/PrpD family protein [Bosea caraganae]RDJ28138.1 MmgE/PrpD family protein [Bosea caraganae]